MLSIIAFFSLFLAQDVVNVGGGSYASFPPETVWDEDWYGTSYRTLKAGFDQLYIVDAAKNRPIPTNHWFTNYFFSAPGGYLWPYPHGIRAEGLESIDVLIPNGFGGVNMAFSILGVHLPDFHPKATPVVDWSDFSFTFREEDGGRSVDVTSVHGVPFEYFEFQSGNTNPTIGFGGGVTFFDVDGKELAFPAQVDCFTIEVDRVIYGIHVKPGSTINKPGVLEILSPYIVISPLPDRSFLAQFDKVARNKPTNTRFTYDYSATTGKLTTTFTVETKNLETGAVGGDTLMTFWPHHWRTTTQNFQWIERCTYTNVRGLTKTAAPGLSWTLSYDWTGFPPYLPRPLDLNADQTAVLAALIKTNADGSGGYDGNTYAKGLGEKTSIMMEAYQTGAKADGDKFRDNMKAQFTNWFTYDKAEEKQYFYSMYPEYGALLGWPCGFGSQGFNDHHFHYGYFVVGAARLMLVDDEFREQFGPFTKLLAQEYANWQHYDPAKAKGADNMFFPFLRTFDVYEGHSYAGGTGDGAGNNQESTSEALNSWWGIYVLGIALNDPELIKLGMMGYKLEVTATGEYWLDLNNDVFPPEYEHEYQGILRSMAISFGTYFSGDPGWVLGIQAVPVEMYYQPYGDIPGQMKRVWEAMLQDSVGERGTADPFDNIQKMDPYLGGYHLGLLATYDPETAVAFLDRLTALGGDWVRHPNIATIYYIAHSYITYGRPAKGYHTSLASGAVYQNAKGELSYLIYNPANAAVDVQIYRDGNVIETVNVGARQYFNSRDR